MKTSAAGRKFIEHWEGLYLHAYDDGGGVWTIGYGHTTAAGAPSVRPGMTCTTEEADKWLSADLARVEANVNRLVKVPLSQGQFDVLVSFDFNTGGLSRSTLLRKLNEHNYAGVADELPRWNRDNHHVVDGLVNRRAAEAKCWNAAPPALVPTVPWWDPLLKVLRGWFRS